MHSIIIIFLIKATLRNAIKVKVKFTLEQATKARGGGVEALFRSFSNLGARRSGWSTPRPGRFTPGIDPVPIV